MAALKEEQSTPVEIPARSRRMRPRLARTNAQPSANDVAALQSRLTTAFEASDRQRNRRSPIA